MSAEHAVVAALAIGAWLVWAIYWSVLAPPDKARRFRKELWGTSATHSLKLLAWSGFTATISAAIIVGLFLILLGW